MDLDLSTEIFELNQAGFEVHEETEAELVLGTIDFDRLERCKASVESQSLQFSAHDINHVPDSSRLACTSDTKETAVCVTVIESDAVLNPAVLVENICVEPGIHAFTRTAS